jgi:hypothetical protein
VIVWQLCRRARARWTAVLVGALVHSTVAPYDAEQIDAEIARDKAWENSLGLAFGSARANAVAAEASATTEDKVGD